jgi:hypothetical protein
MRNLAGLHKGAFPELGLFYAELSQWMHLKNKWKKPLELPQAALIFFFNVTSLR